MPAAPAVLSVEGLTTRFETPTGVFDAVADLSYSVGRGEMLAIVGESGCGKSVQALSLLRLLPPAAKIVAGAASFGGLDLTTADEPAMRSLRGDRISMIFQEPMTSLNPVFSIGDQIMETIAAHERLSDKETVIADLREDRDRWRQQATALLSDHRPQGFLKRLFGR